MVRRYIGVDVASRKLNLYVTHPREGGEDYEILNNQESVGKFIKQKGFKPKDYVVGAESTGRYHLICQKEFVNQGFKFRLINPILTGNKIAHSIRKKKTDKLIRTIPGFAERLSAVVTEEIQDFSRFPSSTQLKAYVGIDPKVTQSGITP